MEHCKKQKHVAIFPIGEAKGENSKQETKQESDANIHSAWTLKQDDDI